MLEADAERKPRLLQQIGGQARRVGGLAASCFRRRLGTHRRRRHRGRTCAKPRRHIHECPAIEDVHCPPPPQIATSPQKLTAMPMAWNIAALTDSALAAPAASG